MHPTTTMSARHSTPLRDFDQLNARHFVALSRDARKRKQASEIAYPERMRMLLAREGPEVSTGTTDSTALTQIAPPTAFGQCMQPNKQTTTRQRMHARCVPDYLPLSHPLFCGRRSERASELWQCHERSTQDMKLSVCMCGDQRHLRLACILQ